MKNIIISAILLYNVSFAQDLVLTVEESISLGLKNSKELQIAYSQVLSSEAAISEVSSSMLPSLSFNASYARLSDVPPFEVNLPILPDPVIIQESYLNNYKLSARIEQPIFTGFKLSSLKSATELNNKAENENLQLERISKSDDIQQVFWKYYTSQQVEKLIEENLNALNEHLNNTENLLKNGLVTKNDLLKLKVEIADAELGHVEAQNNRKLMRALFNKTLSLPLDSKTNVNVEEIEIIVLDYNLDHLIQKAKQNRQELKSTKFRVQALEQKENAAKSDWYPQIAAFGDFYYSNPNQRYMPLEDSFNDTWDVGVALKWNVWNWGGTSAKVEQAKQDYFQAENKLALLVENIELDVYNRHLNLQKAIKKIELSKLQVESASENYRITKQKYYQQLATSTDLIDAEASLLSAKTKQIVSKAEYKMGYSSLSKSIGSELK